MNVHYYQNKRLVKHSVYISVYIHVSQQMFEFLIICGDLLQPVHAPVLLHLMDFRNGSVFLRWCWIHHSGHSHDYNLSSSIHPSMSCKMESGCPPPHGQVFGVWRLHEHELHIEAESPESNLQQPCKHPKAFWLPCQELERRTGKRKGQGWRFGINTFMKVTGFWGQIHLQTGNKTWRCLKRKVELGHPCV